MFNTFIDTHSLYFASRQLCKKKIDYGKLVTWLKDLGVKDTVAYVTKVSEGTAKFSHSLEALGLTVKERPPDISSAPSYYPELSFDIAASAADKKIVCTSSLSLEYILWTQASCTRLVVVGINIPASLKEIAPTIEIPLSLMEA